MEFKKRLKIRLYTAFAFLIFGAAMMLLAAVNGFSNPFFFPYGFAMAIIGIIRICSYRKITADDKSIRKKELAETDERSRMISEQAKSWCFSLSVIGSGIIVILLSVLGYNDQALPFAWFTCGMCLLYWICWIIIQKRY